MKDRQAEIFAVVAQGRRTHSEIENTRSGDIRAANDLYLRLWKQRLPRALVEPAFCALLEQLDRRSNRFAIGVSALAEQLGDPDRRILILTDLVDKGYPPAKHHLGIIRKRQGKPEEALALFSSAREDGYLLGEAAYYLALAETKGPPFSAIYKFKSRLATTRSKLKAQEAGVPDEGALFP